MEKVEDRLAFIGVDCGQSLSSIRPILEEEESWLCQQKGKKEDPRKRKLFLEYKQLMKKMAIQQRMQEREASASKRLQQIKNRRSESKAKQMKSLEKIQQKVCMQSKPQFFEKKNLLKKEAKKFLPKKSLNHMYSTAKENTFKIYHNKTKQSFGLPFINHHQKCSQNIEMVQKGENSFDLIEFGIFSEHKQSQAFLRKLKGSIEKEFLCGVDVQCEEDLDKLEAVLLREIKGEGRWVTEH